LRGDSALEQELEAELRRPLEVVVAGVRVLLEDAHDVAERGRRYGSSVGRACEHDAAPAQERQAFFALSRERVRRRERGLAVGGWGGARLPFGTCITFVLLVSGLGGGSVVS
jgi:hypothetical protein